MTYNNVLKPETSENRTSAVGLPRSRVGPPASPPFRGRWEYRPASALAGSLEVSLCENFGDVGCVALIDNGCSIPC